MRQAEEGTRPKRPWQVLPWEGVGPVVDAMQSGLDTGDHEPEDWRHGVSYRELFGGLMRHAVAWYTGEDRDGKSALHHMAHVGARAIMLTAMHVLGIGNDDRPGTPDEPIPYHDMLTCFRDGGRDQ